jgi:hypothetical protein
VGVEGLHRTNSFTSLQTVDEAEPQEAEQAPRQSLALKVKGAAAGSKAAPAAGSRRKRGGRGRSHGTKQQTRDATSSPGTPRSGQRPHKPGAPLKLADVILPVLKAKAKQQGLTFITSPDKETPQVADAEAKCAGESLQPSKTELPADPRVSAMCDSRSFAEVARERRLNEARDEQGEHSDFVQRLATIKEEVATGGPALHAPTQGIPVAMQSWQTAAAPYCHVAPPQPPPPRRCFQDLLTADEVDFLRKGQQLPADSRTAAATSASPSEALPLQGGLPNGTDGQKGTRGETLDFSRDPVISMHENKHLGPVTCPVKVSQTFCMCNSR